MINEDNNNEENSNEKDEGTTSTKMRDKRIPIMNKVAIRIAVVFTRRYHIHTHLTKKRFGEKIPIRGPLCKTSQCKDKEEDDK